MVSYDIETVTLVSGQLDLTCELPGYAVLRRPITVTYCLENKTDVLQEYAVSMEPSDSFMFSGPKQLKLKVNFSNWIRKFCLSVCRFVR